MNEKDFVKKLKDILQKRIGESSSVEVKSFKNLLYKIFLNEELNVCPNNLRKPTRGKYAFQTDLLILDKRSKVPLVVIEVKFRSLSTHDVLVYSTKAQKHKEVYPYLRYGLVIGAFTKIPNRFFTHNTGFDFAYALDNVDSDNELADLISIIRGQIEISRTVISLMNGNRQVKKFYTKLVVEETCSNS
jgi:hypothetical protein